MGETKKAALQREAEQLISKRTFLEGELRVCAPVVHHEKQNQIITLDKQLEKLNLEIREL
jgi:hypothetical protein